MAERRRLPDERPSITRKFAINGYEGYMTVGLYPDTGQPGELFLKIAKEGSTLSGLMDAFAIVTSIALQHGVPLSALTSKLINTRFEPAGFTGVAGIEYATSPVDFVARWLCQKFDCPEMPAPRKPLVSEAPPPPAEAPQEAKAASPVPDLLRHDANEGPRRSAPRGEGPPCIQCGHVTIRSGACWVCPNCASTTGCG